MKPYTIQHSEFAELLRLDPTGRSFYEDTDSPEDASDYLLETSHENKRSASVYVHFPFCPTRCLSCNRDSIATTDPSQIDQYLNALCSELQTRFRSAPVVDDVHIGGGTPNYLSEEQLIRLTMALHDNLALSTNANIRMHLSSSRSSSTLYSMLTAMGVNSAWFEVRDTNKHVQNIIGRSQSIHLLYDSISAAREAGVREICMDLVYGLPGQSPESVLQSAEEIATFLMPERLDCSSFTTQPANHPNQRALARQADISIADKMVMFNNIVQVMTASGYVWLGLDTFVKPEHPLAKAYARGELTRSWNGLSAAAEKDIIGTGVNAISESETFMVRNFKDHARWRHSVADQMHGISKVSRLNPSRKRSKEILSRLICNERVQTSQLKALEGKQLNIVDRLKDSHFIEDDGINCSLTDSGRLTLHPLLSNNEPRRLWDTLWH